MARLHRDGASLHLILEDGEVEVLMALCEGLALRLAERTLDGPRDPIIERFAPTVSRGDDSLDGELRAMFRPELLDGRAERLHEFSALLRGSLATGSPGADLRLDVVTAMHAVEVLNDLRLAIATSVGLDGDPDQRLDPGADRAETVELLDALAWLQGGIIDYLDVDD